MQSIRHENLKGFLQTESPVGFLSDQKNSEYLHASFIQTLRILLSTRQTAVAVCRRSDGSDNQTSDGAHKHAFPYSHIEKSTIHQPQAGPPFSPERNFVSQAKLFLSFCILAYSYRGRSAICYRYSHWFTYSILLSPTSQRLAEKWQWLVISDCKSLIFYIWQSGLL